MPSKGLVVTFKYNVVEIGTDENYLKMYNLNNFNIIEIGLWSQLYSIKIFKEYFKSLK